MPGMASAAELTSLQQATDDVAEVQFLRLMVVHHRGGVAMATAVVPLTDHDDVAGFASRLVAAQRVEIHRMQAMLADRGSAPA